MEWADTADMATAEDMEATVGDMAMDGVDMVAVRRIIVQIGPCLCDLTHSIFVTDGVSCKRGN